MFRSFADNILDVYPFLGKSKKNRGFHVHIIITMYFYISPLLSVSGAINQLC